MLTAGGGNEEVSDSGPNGHSIFSWTLLQGLEGRADLNSDGYITATELASYIVPSVSSLAHRLPRTATCREARAVNSFSNSTLKRNFSARSRLNWTRRPFSSIPKLKRRAAMSQRRPARNEELRKQLAAIQAQQAKEPLTSRRRRLTPPGHISIKETCSTKRIECRKALDEFLAAAKLDPKSALAANNAGFMYTRLGNLNQAIQWTEKAIAIDPNALSPTPIWATRTFQLNRLDDARRVYQSYLELAPNGAYASTARSG
jgi:tetratricopeptide (TPR) repeat protein